MNKLSGRVDNVLDLNAMVVFERVVRDGSFTAAARSLGLSKSSVSQRVARLEERLGVRLLQRTTRTLRLTDDGAVYYERCARIAAEVREADAALTEARPVPHGLLRVTAPRLFGDAFLVGIVAEFLARYPQARVDLVLAERLVDLVDEGFDVAIRIGRLDDSELRVRGLGGAPSVYCSSPAYLERRGRPADPDQLKEHDLLVVSDTTRATWMFSGGATSRLSVEGRLRVNSLVVARNVALRGAGIAWLPRFLSDDALRSGELVPILEEFAPPAFPIFAVWPSNRHLSAKVRAFLDLLAEQTAAAPPWNDLGLGRAVEEA